ncbi:CH082 protein, partial [Stercorarius parasiticus]|nr:CH082 protein [Stercorarius parasiticus]
RLPPSLRLRLGSGALGAAGPGPGADPDPGAGYRQGQSPTPRTREYFYYIDHQGQLFLDDTKVKNFITCFKDVAFLAFFFKRLEPNRSGRYEAEFPFLSPCGRERNFLRCEDRPIVFTQILPDSGQRGWLLSYCGGGRRLAVPFQPENLVMLPENGRLYHPAPAKAGGVGLVRSALASEWSPGFQFGRGPEQPPTHFFWEGRRYQLTEELLPLLRGGGEG